MYKAPRTRTLTCCLASYMHSEIAGTMVGSCAASCFGAALASSASSLRLPALTCGRREAQASDGGDRQFSYSPAPSVPPFGRWKGVNRRCLRHCLPPAACRLRAFQSCCGCLPIAACLPLKAGVPRRGAFVMSNCLGVTWDLGDTTRCAQASRLHTCQLRRPSKPVYSTGSTSRVVQGFIISMNASPACSARFLTFGACACVPARRST